MKWAIPLYLLVCIWVFGNPNIMEADDSITSSVSTVQTSVKSITSSLGIDFVTIFTERSLTYHTFFFTGLLL